MLKVANSVINASRITGVLPVVNGGTGVTTSTGTGNTVLSASPTLSGDVTLSTGNLVVATTGKGVTTGSAVPLGFGTNSGTAAATLDTSGNVGIGVTPSAWGTVWKALHIQIGAFIASQNNANTVIHVGTNAFANSSNAWTYINTGASTRYEQYLGAHTWFNAPSGTAGTAITFVQTMTLDASGNLGIGATANASAILDAQSTTKGVRMPNMTTTQKNAIASPAAGLMVFDTTLAKLCVYSGAAWQTVTSV